MINTLEEVVEYFRGLADSHVDIADFVYGGSERIIARQTSRINYPVLWLTVPDIVAMGKADDLKWRYTIAVFILEHAPVDAWDKEDANLSKTATIAKHVLLKMQYDSRENRTFFFDFKQATLQPKVASRSDNNHGWAIDFDILTPGDCHDSTNWE